MEEENKSIFEGVAQEVEAPSVEVTAEIETNSDPQMAEDEIVPQANDLSQEEKEKRDGVHKEAHGRVLTIDFAKVLPPKTKSFENGILTKIPPTINEETGSKSYDSKLQVRFVEDNIVAYYPKINFWVDKNGVINPKYSFWREGNNQVSILVRRVLQHMSKSIENGKYYFKLEKQKVNDRDTWVVVKEDITKFDTVSRKVSDVQVLAYLTGKKVKIETSRGIDKKKKTWFRNDIAEILDE